MDIYQAILDWVHLLGTVTWIGGTIFYVLILTPSLGVLEPPQAGKLMGALVKRYALFAWGAIVLLIVSGILIASGRNVTLFKGTAGMLLGIKHIVVACMIVIGAIVGRVIGPKLAALAKPPNGAQPTTPAGPNPQAAKLRRTAGTLGVVNLLFGIAVLALTALAGWA